MNEPEKTRIAKLLSQSLPPVTDNAAQLSRDLWPAMLQRLQQLEEHPAWYERAWFDWALGATAAAWLAFFPAAIPVLLYHL